MSWDRPEEEPWERVVRSPGLTALVVWLFCMPIAWQFPSAVGANPWIQRGAEVPLALGGLAALVLGVLAWFTGERWRGALLGATAGVFAAYLALVLRTALEGTPFGYEAVLGDTGRFSAMVTRYTVAWGSRDGIVGKVATEYPPLFPYVVGKFAWLTGQPGWRVLGPAEVLGISLSLLLSFWLWLRLVGPGAALATSVLVVVAFGRPEKVYEGLALAVVLPWILLTVTRPPGGRLSWPGSGLIGAAIVLTYYAYLGFAVVGVALLIALTYRTEPDRRAYLLHLGKVAAVIVVLSAWWWIPYAWDMVNGGEQVADMYQATEISQTPFPFLDMTLLGDLAFAGLLGLLFYRTRTWWATPLLLVLFGAYVFRVLGMLRWVATAHSTLFYYSTPLIMVVLLTGLVLSLVETAPLAHGVMEWVSERMPGHGGPSRVGVPIMALLLGFAGFMYWSDFMPATTWTATLQGGATPNDPGTWGGQTAREAQEEPLPDGTWPKYIGFAPSRGYAFPVREIQQAVAEVRGRSWVPSVLSDDDKLFAYLPWNGYMDVDRNASYGPVRWDERFADLMRLTRTADPATFAAKSAHTRFGPIDVFILHEDSPTSLQWRPWRVPTTPTFQRSQFAATYWQTQDLTGGWFLAIRKP
jgi:hypothetical protein